MKEDKFDREKHYLEFSAWLQPLLKDLDLLKKEEKEAASITLSTMATAFAALMGSLEA